MSTLRSLVPRSFHPTASASTRDDDSTTLIAGLEPYIRTSITDRIHDGIYDTDIGHKSTLGGRVKRGEIRSPNICQHGKRFAEAPAGPGRQQVLSIKRRGARSVNKVESIFWACSAGLHGQSHNINQRSRFLNPSETLQQLLSQPLRPLAPFSLSPSRLRIMCAQLPQNVPRTSSKARRTTTRRRASMPYQDLRRPCRFRVTNASTTPISEEVWARQLALR